MTDPERSDVPTDPAPDQVLTRSEEELRIFTVRREVERVRLVREIKTETVTRTVEVRHEQVRVERTPMTDATTNASHPGGNDGWMVLYDEEVVITTRRVPRERVRLRVESISENREITALLRTEQIAATGTPPIDAAGPGPSQSSAGP